LFNATFVGTTEDLEVAINTPVGVPGVGNQPVGSIAFSTVADDTNGVTTEVLTSGVLVDTTLVLREVGVDGEGNSEGTVLDELLHVVLFTHQGVGLRGVVSLEGRGVRFVGADVTGARGSVGITLARRKTRNVNVVSATGERVGLAGCGGDTVILEVLLGFGRRTAVAALTTVPAAFHGVSRGEVEIFSDSVNAEAIGRSTCARYGPATATVCLISDHLDGRTLGPLVGRVEGSGKFNLVAMNLAGEFGVSLGLLVSEALLDVADGGAGKRTLIFGSDPSLSRNLIKGVGNFLRNQNVVVGKGGGEDGDDDGEDGGEGEGELGEHFLKCS